MCQACNGSGVVLVDKGFMVMYKPCECKKGEKQNELQPSDGQGTAYGAAR